MRRRTIVIACAVVPWVVALARSWPMLEGAPAASAVTPPAVFDPWKAAHCPPEIGELRRRLYWTLRGEVHGGHDVFVVTAHPERRRYDNEWPLEPEQRMAILERLRAECAADTVDRLVDDPLAGDPVIDPVITFSPSTTRQIIVQVDDTILRFEGYGATAR